MGKYEEAMERAKAGKPLDEVFPELKESEDERIRNLLRRIVITANDGDMQVLGDNDTKRCLDYLEKQKAPLTPEEKMNHPLYLEGFDVGKKVGEVLKEQQPLSTEETELNSIAFLEQLGYTCVPPGTQQKHIEDVIENITKNKEAATKFLKSAGIMDDNGELAEMYRSAQKHAEWSEEDETMWSNLIGFLEGKVGMLPSGKERYIKWLKERFVKLMYPKPGWKPSEEQIEALKLAYEDAFECPESCVPHLPLKDLLNDLKKL